MFFCLVKVKTKASHTGSADSYLSNVPDQVKAISPKHIIGNRGALYSESHPFIIMSFLGPKLCSG